MSGRVIRGQGHLVRRGEGFGGGAIGRQVCRYAETVSTVLVAGPTEIRGRRGETSPPAEGPDYGSLIVAGRRLFSEEAGRRAAAVIRAAIATPAATMPTSCAIRAAATTHRMTVQAVGLTGSTGIIALT